MASILDPVLRWAFGEPHAAGIAVHRLHQRPRFHRNCRCIVTKAWVGDEVWEAVVTMPTACPVCKRIAAARDAEIAQARVRFIDDWLASNGSRDIQVERIPEDMDLRNFTRVYSHLKRLVEECPKGVPKDGVRLSFRKMGRHEFGEWIETEHRLNLSPRWFGSQRGLAQLGARLSRMERVGQSPRGCNTPEYVITHEYGHSLRHRLDGAKYARWWTEADRTGLGTDGTKKQSEGFAEGFSITRHAPVEHWPEAVRRLNSMLREDGVQ